jgi:polyisoprenoid-binding protein YceI
MALERWEIDTDHSSVRFTVRHMVITKVHGQFRRWGGSLELDMRKLSESRVSVRFETASVDTRDPQRDGYLRSRDFFDPERFPHIEFRTTRIEDAGTKKYKVYGDLSVRGVTRLVLLETTLTGQGKSGPGGQRVTFEATAQIDRKEFGLQWSPALEAGGVLVGDKIDIALEIEAKKAP